MNYYLIMLTMILYLTHLPVSFSHGPGGGSSAAKKYSFQNESAPPRKPVSERMKFEIDVHDNGVKLWIRDEFNKPVDTSLASATVVVTGNASPTMFKMMPTEQSHIAGTTPVKVSKGTKFQVTLRIPGEKPVTISFYPQQSSQPTNMSQR